MKASQQTVREIEQALHNVVSRYPQGGEPVMTDINIAVSPDTGEMCMFNDDDEVLDSRVIAEWAGSPLEDFQERVAVVLRGCIRKMDAGIRGMSVLQPFSFVLVDNERETIQDLCVIDSEETMVLDGSLLQGLDEDLDNFLQHLLAD